MRYLRVDWIHQARSRVQRWVVVNKVMNNPVPKKEENNSVSTATITFSRSNLALWSYSVSQLSAYEQAFH
jgi:hypothetical protein